MFTNVHTEKTSAHCVTSSSRTYKIRDALEFKWNIYGEVWIQYCFLGYFNTFTLLTHVFLYNDSETIYTDMHILVCVEKEKNTSQMFLLDCNEIKCKHEEN